MTNKYPSHYILLLYRRTSAVRAGIRRRNGSPNDAPRTVQLFVRVRLRGELPLRMDAAVDDRKLDQRVLLLYHIRHAGVRAPADDARPGRFPAQGTAGAVEHHAGHVQPGRIRPDSTRAVPGAQQIRPAPFGVRHQVNNDRPTCLGVLFFY